MHASAQRQRQTDGGGAAVGRGDAGDHLHLDAGPLQRGDLLGGAAEHERIAALQPRHAPAGQRLAHQDAIDLLLRRRRPVALLADIDPDRIGAGVSDHGGIDEAVDNEHVGRGDAVDRFQRQQLGIAGSAADERHRAARRAPASLCGMQVVRSRVHGAGLERCCGASPRIADRGKNFQLRRRFGVR